MKRKKLLGMLVALAFICGLGIVAKVDTLDAKVKVSSVKVDVPYAKSVYVAKGKKVTLLPLVRVSPNQKAKTNCNIKLN